jgi:hypothetical protein
MGTGGAKWGAGRPGYRLKAEQTLKVDLRIWRKLGYLVNGNAFGWQWSRGEEVTGNIGVSVRADSIRLGYTAQGRDASQTIQTTATPCRYGGARTWFQCPCCGGRAVVLFMRAGRFACRQCQKVGYSSQSGSAHDRANVRYHQLHALIEAGKPKWQRWATFERLEDRFDRVNEQVNRSLMMFIQRLQAGR